MKNWRQQHVFAAVHEPITEGDVVLTGVCPQPLISDDLGKRTEPDEADQNRASRQQQQEPRVFAGLGLVEYHIGHLSAPLLRAVLSCCVTNRSVAFSLVTYSAELAGPDHHSLPKPRSDSVQPS